MPEDIPQEITGGTALAYFEYLKSIGIDFVEPAEATAVIASEKEEDLTARRTLKELNEDVAACKACALHKTRSQTVFGTGSPNAGLMFVGEAPGAQEDAQGKPFVGRAGKLLTKMIEAIQFRREEVFIANVLKCRPPDNRPPTTQEKDACEHFLIDQIRIIKPALICALGTHAAQTLLKTKEPIGRLRGNFYDYNGVPLLPTYHPSFLNRSPQFKKLAWEDLQTLRDRYKEIKG